MNETHSPAYDAQVAARFGSDRAFRKKLEAASARLQETFKRMPAHWKSEKRMEDLCAPATLEAVNVMERAAGPNYSPAVFAAAMNLIYREGAAAKLWAVATPSELHKEAYARPKRHKKAVLAPMLRALWEARSEDPGREHGKKWLCKEAAAILVGEAGDEEAEALARDVIASDILGESLPTAKTLEDWYLGASVEDMLTADGASVPGSDE